MIQNLHDNGSDILVFNTDQNLLIQVKQSLSLVGINSCQEINYKLPEYSKQYDVKFKTQVITNNYYSSGTLEFAKDKGIELLNRTNIISWLKEYPIDLTEIEAKLNASVYQKDGVIKVVQE